MQKNAMDINLNLLSSIYILNIFSAIIACKIKEIKTQSPKYWNWKSNIELKNLKKMANIGNESVYIKELPV